jgi:hypothetical protein
MQVHELMDRSIGRRRFNLFLLLAWSQSLRYAAWAYRDDWTPVTPLVDRVASACCRTRPIDAPTSDPAATIYQLQLASRRKSAASGKGFLLLPILKRYQNHSMNF